MTTLPITDDVNEDDVTHEGYEVDEDDDVADVEDDVDEDDDVDDNVIELNDVADVANDDTNNEQKVVKGISFKTWLRKVIKSLDPTKKLELNAAVQVDAALQIIAEKISTLANSLTFNKNRATISEKNVSTACQLLIKNDELIKFAEQAIETFKDYDPSKIDDKKRSICRATQAGILFPPHIAEKYLRQFGASTLHISNKSPIFLAAVLEYIATAIFRAAGLITIAQHRNVINIRHVILGIASDEFLVDIVNAFNIHFIGGGCVPFIDKRVYTKKTSPCIKDIKKYQKSAKLLVQYEPFRRLLREQATEFSGGQKMHFNIHVYKIIQYYTEQQIVIILKNALNAMLHANRVTLQDQDIYLVYKLLYKQDLEHATSIGIENITMPCLNRLARRAGVTRISDPCLLVLQKCFGILVEKLLKPTIILTNNFNIKTITVELIKQGAKTNDINLSIV